MRNNLIASLKQTGYTYQVTPGQDEDNTLIFTALTYLIDDCLSRQLSDEELMRNDELFESGNRKAHPLTDEIYNKSLIDYNKTEFNKINNIIIAYLKTYEQPGLPTEKPCVIVGLNTIKQLFNGKNVCLPETNLIPASELLNDL